MNLVCLANEKLVKTTWAFFFQFEAKLPPCSYTQKLFCNICPYMSSKEA